jgi:soluble lytic murein transglycosylase-like protein
MAEIQARMDSLSAKPAFQLPENGTSGLSGNIGNGTAPMNPFGQGLKTNFPKAPDSLRPLIYSAADGAGVDRHLFEALVGVESGFDTRAESRAGAKGLAQLMPSTAAALGVTNAFDPQQNLQAGAKYLAQLLLQFGDIPKALAAYNAGPGAVTRANGIPANAETPKYVNDVLQLLEQLKKQ